MKKYIKNLLALLTVIALVSACQKLEMEDNVAITDELLWENPSYIENFVVDIIAAMPSGFATDEFGWTFYANTTDEAENSHPRSAANNFNTGNWNSTSGAVANVWNNYYNGIYKANLFLDKTAGLTYETYAPAQRELFLKRLDYFEAEVRFLRALFYYELVKHFGGVVLLEDMSVNGLQDLRSNMLDLERSSFTKCAEYIISECDFLIDNELLPLLDEGADQGRPNGTAAKALKCKTQLLLASPVYNTEISEGSTQQIEYWKDVAATAEDIAFDKIFSFGEYDVYDGTSTEVILGYRHRNINQLESRNFPIGSEGVNISLGSTNPSQNLVDAYRMKNGKKIDDPDSGYDPQNPYEGRDDRLKQTILYNGVSWDERNIEPRTIEIFRGGRDGMDRDFGTRTGYYLKKYIDPSLDLRQGQGSNREWPIFRFADIILIWAEAVNEVWGPATLGDSYLTATTILNQTITRHGGLEELPLTGITKEEMRERIREERFIELAFEDQRAWDLRRWNTATEVLNQPLLKMEVTTNGDGSFNYEKQVLEDRFFAERMNLYPIPQRDVNNGLNQNEGW